MAVFSVRCSSIGCASLKRKKEIKIAREQGRREGRKEGRWDQNKIKSIRIYH
jgi:hypothetical protein